MKRLSAALAGTITTATPIAQIALAHWILQEPVTWSLAGGGVLILAGVLGMVYAERSQTENEPNRVAECGFSRACCRAPRRL